MLTPPVRISSRLTCCTLIHWFKNKKGSSSHAHSLLSTSRYTSTPILEIPIIEMDSVLVFVEIIWLANEVYVFISPILWPETPLWGMSSSFRRPDHSHRARGIRSHIIPCLASIFWRNTSHETHYIWKDWFGEVSGEKWDRIFRGNERKHLVSTLIELF